MPHACEICGREPKIGTLFPRTDLKLWVCNDCGFKADPFKDIPRK